MLEKIVRIYVPNRKGKEQQTKDISANRKSGILFQAVKLLMSPFSSSFKADLLYRDI